MADTGVTVVGAGVVGLAVAARLARRRRDLVILERRERHGTETSSRNSEVVHAGIHYAEGSLKAQLCLEGNRRLHELCAAHGLPHRRLGKIVVAAEEAELEALEGVRRLAAANGVPLTPLTAAEVHELEPRVRAVAGLLSPTTGILSAHALVDHFLGLARRAGAVLQTRAELVRVERQGGDYRLTVRTPAGEESFTSERVVNAAGLGAEAVAAAASIDVDAAGYRLHPCKGSYFRFAGPGPLCSRLVYPVPGRLGLGVHAVLGLDGRLRFGPDAEYVDDPTSLAVDPARRPPFAASVRHLFPEVRDEDLEPDLAGMRPKLQAPDGPPRDFVIAEEGARGLPGLVSLVGIESPGLTAAPAIAERVARLLEG